MATYTYNKGSRKIYVASIDDDNSIESDIYCIREDFYNSDAETLFDHIKSTFEEIDSGLTPLAESFYNMVKSDFERLITGDFDEIG